MADRVVGIRGLALVVALLLTLACERAERKGPDEAVTQPSAPTASEALGPGEARVDVDESGVTIECQAAARGLLLEKLARAGRFELVGDLDARPLTLELRGQPIETVIAALLEDLPYRAQWRYDAKSDRHELARLEVGEIRAAAAAAAGESAAEKAKRRELADTLRQQIRERREQDRGSEEQKAELAARREERARSQADLLEQLRSSNPEMRIEAIEGLDPEGPALAARLEVLRSDPDARVREKAAEQGGEADGFLACAGLLDALGDREPAVVLRALASLEFTCDETVLPIVQKHCELATDPAVQARCAEAIDFLQ